MNKKILICLTIFILIALQSFAFDEEALNLVYFENLTSNTIEFIFLSPGDSEYWGPDLLNAEEVLGAGETLGFYLLYPNDCDDFDILAVDENGSTMIIYDYTICDEEEEFIQFVKKDFRDEPPDFELVTIYISNDTIPIYYLFISPKDSALWGSDFLDKDTILESDGYFSLLFPASEELTAYNLMAIDEDGDRYQFNFDVGLESDEYVFSIEVGDLQS